MGLTAPNRHTLRAVTSKLCQTRGIPRNWSEMHTLGASLVVQQSESTCQCRGNRFDPWEGPTCCGATKAMCHEY